MSRNSDTSRFMPRLLPLSVAAAFALLTLQHSVQAADAATAHKLSLSEARVLWQAHSHELELGRLQLDGSRFDEISAAQRPNPTLTVQSLFPTTRRDTDGSDTTIGISQLIERGGKRDLRTSVAQSNTRATEHALSDLQRAQGLMVSQAYFDLKLAGEMLDIDRGMAALYRESLAAAETRQREGDVPASDVTRLRVEVARMDNQLRQDGNTLRQAQLGLAYLLGVDGRDASALMAADPWPDVSQGRQLASEDALARRPDIRAAQERLEGARTALELARAQLTRDVTVGMTGERHALASNTVGVQLSVPLFVNYQYQGEIGKAQNALMLAQAQIERVNAQAKQEIDQAQSDLDTAHDRLQRFEGGLLGDAERAAMNAEFAFRHGASSVVELLDARRTYLATQTEAATARADYAKALAAWRAALALQDVRS